MDTREDIIFEAARQLPSDKQEAYLSEACQSAAQYEQVQDLMRDALVADEYFASIEAAQPDIAETPGTIIGRYKVHKQLGEGGFGMVYLAEQQEPVKRKVALKIIKIGMDTRQVIARFEAERQALAMMDHPNIAKVYDAGATETGRPYFVMELVNGIPITEYCNHEKLNTEDRLDLFIKVCHAVQHAHQKGIIHRDLKPSNILVSLQDGVPIPKVIDFGIAKATHQEFSEKTVFTKFEQFIGTPSYMSPEQAEMSGSDIDTRSDIYSLGVLLYEMLTGRPPFDSKELLDSGLDEMRKIIREKDPVRPSTRIRTTIHTNLTPPTNHTNHRALRGDLDWIVMKCLEKERSRRYDTANGLAMDLVRHLNHEPIVARPPSRVYRLQKAWQRNKLLFTAGAAIAVALIAGIAVSTWQATVATRAKATLQENLARQLLQRGQTLCQQNQVAAGLHWMVRAINETPKNDAALRLVIENNLIAWSQQWVEPATVLFHDVGTTKGGFSPDGSKIITGSYDGDISLWSVPSGELVWKNEAHDGEIIRTAMFLGNGDRILTAGRDDKARLWFPSGEPAGQPMAALTSSRVTASADGQLIAAQSDPHSVRIHSGLDGDLRATLSHENRVYRNAFHPAGEILVTVESGGRVRFWNARGGSPVGRDLEIGENVRVRKLAFGPNGKRVAFGCADGTVQLWSVETRQRLHLLKWHEKAISAVHFHPDPADKRLLTASEDQTARLWDTETGSPIGPSMRHEGPILDAAFNARGSHIVTTSLDKVAKLWSTDTAEAVGPPLRQTSPVMAARFSPNGNSILTFTSSPEAFIWDATREWDSIVRLDSGAGTATACFSADGKRVFTGNRYRSSGSQQIYDSETEKLVADAMVAHNRVWSVCLSPDGRFLATGGEDGNGLVWDVETGVLKCRVVHDHTVRSVTWSTDSKMLATASFDTTARVWSATDGNPIGSPLEHPGIVEELAFGDTDQGRILVTACADGKARAWSVDTGELILPVMEHGNALLSVDVSPDGDLIATGGRDTTVKLWKVSDGQPTGMVLPHDSSVQDVRFSKTGRWLLTASEANSVQLWSTASGEQIGPHLYSDPNAGPWESRFNPDETQVVIADHGNGAVVVDLPKNLDQPHPDPRLWIEVLTRMTMDEYGTLTQIENEDWKAKRERLAGSGISKSGG